MKEEIKDTLITLGIIIVGMLVVVGTSVIAAEIVEENNMRRCIEYNYHCEK